MWLGSPSTAKSTASHPRPGARSTRAAPGAWRPHGPPRWPWRTRTPTLVGARVPRARSAPHARARLGCRTPRAEGGAGTSRADAPLVWGCGISLRNCSDVKSHVPYTLGHTGGPRVSRPDTAWGHILPATARPTPHNGPAREVPAPPSARDVRTGPHVGPTTARRAKYPRRPRRVASTLSHLMRPPHASTPCAPHPPRNSPQKI